MKKMISIFFITSFLLFILISYRDIELFYKCTINNGGYYQDSISCNGINLIDGGYLTHFYRGNSLFIVYVKITYNYPNICYSNELMIYVYDYINHSGDNMTKEEFIKKYRLNFYKLEELPKRYLDSYSQNCI